MKVFQKKHEKKYEKCDIGSTDDEYMRDATLYKGGLGLTREIGIDPYSDPEQDTRDITRESLLEDIHPSHRYLLEQRRIRAVCLSEEWEKYRTISSLIEGVSCISLQGKFENVLDLAGECESISDRYIEIRRNIYEEGIWSRCGESLCRSTVDLVDK